MRIERSVFIRRLLAFAVGSGLFRQGSLARAIMGPTPDSEGKATGPKMPMVDLHSHPPLKGYLWGKKIWKCYPSQSGANIVNMQVDIHKLEKGNMKGVLAVHYLPERGLVEETKSLRKIFPKLRSLFPVFVEKLEHGDGGNYRQVNTMIDEFEEQMRLSNEKHDGAKMRVAKRYADFERIMNDGDIAVAHSIEGAHSLGRDLDGINSDKYIEHLDYFIDRGVCMMTLAHFFANDVVSPVEGIPPGMKEKLKLAWKFDPEEDDKPLTPVGKRVVERMLERRMVVDLTHSTPAARKDVYALNQTYNRPLVFSHTGVRALFAGKGELANFKYMSPDDDEIRIIQACGGVIGVIFMNFWLTGCDMHTDGCKKRDFKNGMDHVVATIAHIRQVTGTYDHIAIGSDFDGLADAPHDLRDHSCMNELVDRIRLIPGITTTEVENIVFRNSLRVLKNGWRN